MEYVVILRCPLKSYIYCNGSYKTIYISHRLYLHKKRSYCLYVFSCALITSCTKFLLVFILNLEIGCLLPVSSNQLGQQILMLRARHHANNGLFSVSPNTNFNATRALLYTQLTSRGRFPIFSVSSPINLMFLIYILLPLLNVL